MKHKLTLRLLLLLSSITVCQQGHAMEYIRQYISPAFRSFQSGNNHRIGTIDMLMLARAVAQKGYSTVEQEINAHEFLRDAVYESMPPQYGKEPEPFCIHNRCTKNDGTELSDNAFHMINKTVVQEMKLEVENPLNKAHHRNYIDECTTWAEVKEDSKVNSKVVDLTASFYDKAAALTALRSLRQ